MKCSTNGTWLALAAIGAVAMAGARRGSRAQQIATVQQKFPPITSQQVNTWLTEPRFLELIAELEEMAGHYGKAQYADYFAFDIKVHNAYAPDWVAAYLGWRSAGEYISDDARDQLEWFIENIQDKDSPAYQPWFTGKWAQEGRSGGHLLLEHDLYLSDLEDLAERWKDERRPTLAGFVPTQDYLGELEEAIPALLDCLRRREDLENQIARSITGFEQYIRSDEEWQVRLDLTDAEVATLKAQANDE